MVNCTLQGVRDMWPFSRKAAGGPSKVVFRVPFLAKLAVAACLVSSGFLTFVYLLGSVLGDEGEFDVPWAWLAFLLLTLLVLSCMKRIDDVVEADDWGLRDLRRRGQKIEIPWEQVADVRGVRSGRAVEVRDETGERRILLFLGLCWRRERLAALFYERWMAVRPQAAERWALPCTFHREWQLWFLWLCLVGGLLGTAVLNFYWAWHWLGMILVLVAVPLILQWLVSVTVTDDEVVLRRSLTRQRVPLAQITGVSLGYGGVQIQLRRREQLTLWAIRESGFMLYLVLLYALEKDKNRIAAGGAGCCESS